jgi:hypothetical protein
MTAKKSKPTTSTAPQIEQWPTSQPIPYARNARKIDARAVSAVAGSIKEFGFKSPILVDTEGVIIAGHTRLQAAQSLGLESVPVIVCQIRVFGSSHILTGVSNTRRIFMPLQVYSSDSSHTALKIE